MDVVSWYLHKPMMDLKNVDVKAPSFATSLLVALSAKYRLTMCFKLMFMGG